jgi:ABC-2 type transport system permease protein
MIATLTESKSQAAAAFMGFVARDVRALARSWREFLSRTVIQPALFVFVFAYVLPKLGGGVDAGSGHASFATVLLPGQMAFSGTYAAIFGVGIAVSVDLGITREIDDRVLAPCGSSTIAFEKILFGAVQGLLAALVVVPIFFVLTTQRAVVQIDWPVLIAALVLMCTVAGAIGLLIGTYVPHDRLGAVFSLVPVLLISFGCTFYTWESLRRIRWLQAAVAVDPLVYMSEALRAGFTPSVTHMRPAVSLGVLTAFACATTALAVARFVRKCTE